MQVVFFLVVVFGIGLIVKVAVRFISEIKLALIKEKLVTPTGEISKEIIYETRPNYESVNIMTDSVVDEMEAAVVRILKDPYTKKDKALIYEALMEIHKKRYTISILNEHLETVSHLNVGMCNNIEYLNEDNCLTDIKESSVSYSINQDYKHRQIEKALISRKLIPIGI